MCIRDRLSLVVAAEEAGLGIELVAFVYQERSVGVLGHVMSVVALVLDNVVDDAPDEGDVGARAQGHEDVRLGRRPGVARIHAYHLGAVLLPGLLPPTP